ncbi:MAG: tRNA pseudouridine(55) synthase TruB [Ramlibacter sp.]
MHGVLLLDKPRGLSSNDALQKCKWLLRAEKAGHTGTLDPLATGVLPLCFGAATKFSQLHLDADKTYEAVAVLGVRTTTADAEGDVVEQRPVPAISTHQLQVLQARFTGTLRQVPPMHSALKKDGRPLYDYARAGQVVEREPRDIIVHALQLALGQQDGQPVLRFTARVSKGTYIRSLGEDLGEVLGCGAHLSFLRRTATGTFDIGQCTTIEALQAKTEDERLAALRPVESLLQGHPRLRLAPADAGRFLSGLRRRGSWADAPAVAVFSDEPPALLGTGHVKAGELIPGRLLSPIDIQQILGSQEPVPTIAPAGCAPGHHQARPGGEDIQ